MSELTREARIALLSGRSSNGRPWLKIVVPKGTIVPVVLFSNPPDIFRIDGEDWLDFVFELMI